MKKLCIVLIGVLLLPCFALPSLAKNPIYAEIYVSENGDDSSNGSLEFPFKTIQRAKSEVRKINKDMSGDIIVYLRGGVYIVNSENFDELDSGFNGNMVVYKAFEGERPIISGEKKLGPWEMYDKEKNIFRTPLDTTISTRQLYINGKRALRARTQGVIPKFMYDDEYQIGMMPEMAHWKSQNEIELIYTREWTNSRAAVESISLEGNYAVVKMQQPGFMHGRTKSGDQDAHNIKTPWYIENAFELLDIPGEWYFDRTEGFVYYMPREGENLHDDECKVAISENLLSLRGSSLDNPIKNILFDGIEFSYTTWLRPGTALGHPDAQSNVMRLPKSAGKSYHEELISRAAIELATAINVNIENCRFTRLGGAGINAILGSKDIYIKGNYFNDISGSGIQIGEPDRNNPNNQNPSDRRYVIENISITNNYISHIGVEYRSAVGIFGATPSRLLVENNEICYFPYSGITVGWEWSTKPTVCSDNSFRMNYIHNGIRELRDSGGIYTLGEQPRTEIFGNFIEKLSGRDGGAAGVYLDQGSSYIAVSNNVIRDVSAESLSAWSSDSHDYIFKNNYSNNSKTVSNANAANGKFEGNVFVDGNPCWSVPEAAIMVNAGLQKEYWDIRPIDNSAPDAPYVYIKTISPDEIFLEWDPVYDDVGVNWYYIYVNGKYVGRTYDIRYSVPVVEGEESTITVKAVDAVGRSAETSIDVLAPMFPYEVINIDFEDGMEGKSAPGFETRELKGAVQIEKSGNNKYLRVTSHEETGKGTYNIELSPLKGKLSFEASVMALEDTTTWRQIFAPFFGPPVNESNREYHGYICFNEEKIVAYDGTNFAEISKLETGKWYNIKLILDTKSDVYDVYLENELKVSGFAKRGTSEEINGIWGNVSGRAGSFAVDNIRITKLAD